MDDAGQGERAPETLQGTPATPPGRKSTRAERKALNKARWAQMTPEEQADHWAMVHASRTCARAKDEREAWARRVADAKERRRKVVEVLTLAIARAHVACEPPHLTCERLGITLNRYWTLLDAAPDIVQRLHRLADTLALTAPLALGVTTYTRRTAPTPTYTELPLPERHAATVDEVRQGERLLARAAGLLEEMEGVGLGGDGASAGGRGAPSTNFSQNLQATPSLYFSQNPTAPPVTLSLHAAATTHPCPHALHAPCRCSACSAPRVMTVAEYAWLFEVD